MNYTIKIPNDGVLYISAADHYIDKGSLVNTATYLNTNLDLEPYPTNQFLIVYFIVFLKLLFKEAWLFFYIVALSVLWTVLINKLIKFSKKNFLIKKNLLYIFPVLIFFNYDYLISASSFYNEALYYPFLLFSLLKINNSIEKKKNIFDKSFLLCLFLIIGIFFRLQHLPLLASLMIFFLIFKKKKEFLYICFLTIISITVLYILINNLNLKINITSTESQLYNFKDLPAIIIDKLKDNIPILSDENLYDATLKNLRVHISIYVHFLNLPKLVDINLHNLDNSIKEISYFIFSLMVLFFIAIDLIKKKLGKYEIFLILYFIFTSIFLFLLNDYTSRYFLFTNFVVIFFFMKNFFIQKNLKLIIKPTLFLILVILSTYAFGYFNNTNTVNNTKIIHETLKEFKKNRDGYFDDKDIIISGLRYNVFWILGKPSLRPSIVLNDFKSLNPENRYYYVGFDVYKYFSEESSYVKKIVNYSKIDAKSGKTFYISRIYINDN